MDINLDNKFKSECADGVKSSAHSVALILDYDGTLFDTQSVYEPAFRRFMKEITDAGWIAHAEYTSEEISGWIGITPREMWLAFRPELSEEQREFAAKRIGEYMLEDLFAGKGRLYPEVCAVLASLRERYELILLSNCGNHYLEAHTKTFSLDRWIHIFYCTGDYGFISKEEVFEKYIKQDGVKYIAVGDRYKDMLLAKNSGIDFIGCTYGFGSSEELDGADALIDSIEQLPEAVERILANNL